MEEFLFSFLKTLRFSVLAAQPAVPVTGKEATHILFSFEAKPQFFVRRHLVLLVFILLFFLFFFFAQHFTETQVVPGAILPYGCTLRPQNFKFIVQASAIFMHLRFQGFFFVCLPFFLHAQLAGALSCFLPQPNGGQSVPLSLEKK